MEIRPIDANALALDFLHDSKDAGFFRAIYEGAAKRVHAAPTLDYAPVRHGEWIPLEEPQWNCFGLVTIGYRCSECGREESHNNEPYCHCGAKMDGGEKDG